MENNCHQEHAADGQQLSPFYFAASKSVHLIMCTIETTPQRFQMRVGINSKVLSDRWIQVSLITVCNRRQRRYYIRQASGLHQPG